MKILVTFGCRSDIGLSEPIVRRLRQVFDVQLINLFPQDFKNSYIKMEQYCNGSIGDKPDLVFLTGDRVEQAAAAQAAFLNNIPIAHYYGGVINTPVTTYDDVLRHTISLLSDIQFVESEDALGVVWDLKHAVGLKSNAFVVGISHLDDLEIDESEVIYDWTLSSETHGKINQMVSPYDLVLINSINDLELPEFKFNKTVIGIGGNPDGEVDLEKWVGHVLYVYYDNLPRPQFLGLLKNCQRFITNSSTAIYEAPHFLKPDQIIMVGNRNRNRPPVVCIPGASDKIVKILQGYLLK